MLRFLSASVVLSDALVLMVRARTTARMPRTICPPSIRRDRVPRRESSASVGKQEIKIGLTAGHWYRMLDVVKSLRAPRK